MVDRISEADKTLILSTQAKTAALRIAANELEQFISDHFAAVYKLNPGDSVENGVIIRKPEESITE